MSGFEREGRYIVVKPDFMDSSRTMRLRSFIEEMCFETPDCVVVEADWPEYETVWRMIERRVTGASADAKPVEVLGYSVVGNRYAIRLTKGEVLELSENYADHLIELVDRKHLTDAQSELAALREELAGANRRLGACINQIEEQQQRLAAVEQRNAELEKNAARYIWLRDKSESVHQFYLSTPIWFTGVKFNQESVDSAIDAAMTKPTESGASES